jgi:N-acetyl sugar amidotransferase
MRRCRTCCYPDTKPDLYFDESGECSACVNARKKPLIDWDSRKVELLALLDRHDGRCIVPSSGGKDSTWQVLKLLDLGADVTIVTATTCYLTEIGRKNIDNLARYARTIEYSPNKTVRAKLNKIGLEMVGDISWPEHTSIFATPFQASVDLDIPLVFYGENPQQAYGGPLGTDEAKEMTRRWVNEFGGLLGLRPADIVGMDGITARDMHDYMLPCESYMEHTGTQAHFLGQYFEWDSQHNAEVAILHGMKSMLPCEANWWDAENLDNALHGIHDHMMYLKYGYGRGCAQVSVDVRNGLTAREQALKWIRWHDGLFPSKYMGVHIDDVLDHIGISHADLQATLDRFTNFDLFEKGALDQTVPKEWACSQNA